MIFGIFVIDDYYCYVVLFLNINQSLNINQNGIQLESRAKGGDNIKKIGSWVIPRCLRFAFDLLIPFPGCM